MVPEIVTAYETDSLAGIIDKMCTERLHRLIIVNQEQQVAGIITTMDVMCYLRKTYLERTA